LKALLSNYSHDCVANGEKTAPEFKKIVFVCVARNEPVRRAAPRRAPLTDLTPNSPPPSIAAAAAHGGDFVVFESELAPTTTANGGGAQSTGGARRAALGTRDRNAIPISGMLQKKSGKASKSSQMR
jgi:uncharacterized protein YbjT (DUF2867 family)